MPRSMACTKSMVLEEPKTFAAADRAVDHFDDIQAAYNTMKTAEQQVEVLQDIPATYDAMTDALSEVELIDTFRIHSPGPATPFSLWQYRSEASLLQDAIIANRTDHQGTGKKAAEARTKRIELKAKIADVKEQQRLNGGDALEAAERALEKLNAELTAVRAERAKFDARTEALGGRPETREQFDALFRDSETFLSEFSGKQAELRELRDQTIRDAQPLLAERDGLQQEADSLAGRHGLVPHDLHAARLAVAETMGLAADDLPFVAELIDMQPQFEQWRTAAELALGGFAVTMLVDQQLLPQLRRNINSREIRRRLRFEGAPVHQNISQKPDAAILPGRLKFRDGAFTGWLTNTLAAKFGYVCVDSAADLDSADFALTITGQTRHGRRGAHGGHGAPHVIGFSNERRLQQIAERIKAIDSNLTQLQRAATGYDTQGKTLERERDGHMHMTATTWTTIDVAAVKTAIGQQGAIREGLLTDNDILQKLKQLEEALQKELERAERAMYAAEAAQETLDKAHRQLVSEQDLTGTLLQQLEDDQSIVLTASQEMRLRAEYERIARPWSLARFPRIHRQA